MTTTTLPAGRADKDLEALKSLAASGAAHLGWNAPASEVIAWAAENVDARDLAVACSMADAVLPQLVAEQIPGVDVLFLETGYHFPETHQTRRIVGETLDVRIVDVLPELTVEQQDATHGKDLFARDPQACCAMRKVEPLAESLQDYEVWFTGVRRDESPTRTDAPLVSFDETHKLVKVNPMVRWSLDDLVEHSQTHGLPVNPLLSEGYLSIGCAPCTRKVAPGEDPRAGRWSGSDKIECGIHL